MHVHTSLEKWNRIGYTNEYCLFSTRYIIRNHWRSVSRIPQWFDVLIRCRGSFCQMLSRNLIKTPIMCSPLSTALVILSTNSVIAM